MITVYRKKQPRRAGLTSDGYTMEEEYLVYGVTDQLSALVAVGTGDSDTLPTVGDSYVIEDYPMVVDRLEAVEFDDDDTRWTVRVSYKPDRNEGERRGSPVNSQLSSFSFDTGSATKNITQAKTNTPADKSFAKSGETAPLSGGLIGWDGEKAQGVDIEVGAFTFSKTVKYSDSEIPESYIKKLGDNAHTVNDATFSLWEAGEVEFIGAQGRHSPSGEPKSSGDSNGQLGGFSGISGANADNTANGALFVSLRKLPGQYVVGAPNRYEIILYKSATFADADEVARVSLAEIGVNQLTQSNGSGISGTITLFNYVNDTTSISILFPFPWEITYNFAVSPNETDLAVGDITITEKKGWEYADVRYGPEEQTVGTDVYLIEAAKYAYVHEVKETADFSFLKLDVNDIIP